MTIESETKKQIISENRRHDTDSGSPEVQIAVLTAQIKELTTHMPVSYTHLTLPTKA